MEEDKKVKYNKNNEELRNLSDEEKKGLEKLRKENPAYADFVGRALPSLDATKSFVAKTVEDAKKKIEENKEISEKNKKNPPQKPPMFHDEKIAKPLISEGDMILDKTSKDIASLEEAIETGKETVSQVTYITSAAVVPLTDEDPNQEKKFDENDRDEENEDDRDRDEEDKNLYQKKEENVNAPVLERVREKSEKSNNKINPKEGKDESGQAEEKEQTGIEILRGIDHFGSPKKEESKEKSSNTKGKNAVRKNEGR